MSRTFETLRENFIKAIMKEMEEDDGKKVRIIPSNNKEHGFFGEMLKLGVPENMIDNYWNETSEHLQRVGKLSPEDTRSFLDSKGGRKLADELKDKASIESDAYLGSLKKLLTPKEIKTWFEFYNH